MAKTKVSMAASTQLSAAHEPEVDISFFQDPGTTTWHSNYVHYLFNFC